VPILGISFTSRTHHDTRVDGGTNGSSGDDGSTMTSSRKRKLGDESNAPEGQRPANQSPEHVREEGRGGECTDANGSTNGAAKTATPTMTLTVTEGLAEPNRNKDLMERITEMEMEKQQIEEGTHPEWQKKLNALQKVRDRRVFAAERFKQMQVENIKGLYEYEVMEAESTYKVAMDELKTRLLDTMEQRVKRLEEDRERVLKQLERVGQTRLLRSKNVLRAEDPGDPLQGGAVGRVGGGSTAGNVSMFLSDGEIKDDLRVISKDLAERARAYYDAQSDSMVEVSVEDNCLHYKEHCLLKGESIVFTSMLSGEDFVGRIASVRPHELLVRLSDGTKARIHLNYLRNGRIKLKTDSDSTEL